jgi:hypothetical protein
MGRDQPDPHGWRKLDGRGIGIEVPIPQTMPTVPVPGNLDQDQYGQAALS